MGVYPTNDPDTVEKIGKRLGLDLDTFFTLTNIDGQFTPAAFFVSVMLFLGLRGPALTTDPDVGH